jgi:hypothetical protein
MNNNETAGKACTEKEKKYRKQPERYATLGLDMVDNII